MIAPPDKWTAFLNDDEKLSMFKQWNLISTTSTWFRELFYSGLYVETPTPCEVIGYINDRNIVLKIAGELHTINAEYFSQMQSASSIPLEYVVLDLETTGLSHARDRIVEIAAIKYRSAEAIDSFHSLINPDCSMPLTAQAVHGITDAMVADAPCLEVVLPQLSKFLGTLPIVAHNAAFDVGFLKTAFDQNNLKFTNKAFDTLKLSKKAFPAFSSYALSDLIKYLDIPITESHRAFPDVQATAILFQKCFEVNAGLESDVVDLPAKSDHSGSPSVTAESFKTHVLSPEYEESSVVYDKVDKLVFDQKTFVITGDIENYTRAELQEMIESYGGKMSGVNRNLDYLIVGMQNKNIVKDTSNVKSTKIIKAEQLRDDGYPIKIISDEFFLSQLEVQHVYQLSFDNDAAISVVPPEQVAFNKVVRFLNSPLLAQCKITLKKNKAKYYSIIISSEKTSYRDATNDLLFARLWVGKGDFDLSFNQNFSWAFKRAGIECFKAEKDFIKISNHDFSKVDMQKQLRNALNVILKDLFAFDEFGCCSRYMECSNEQCCLMPDLVYATACQYGKNLSDGQVFYGSNRNID